MLYVSCSYRCTIVLFRKYIICQFGRTTIKQANIVVHEYVSKSTKQAYIVVSFVDISGTVGQAKIVVQLLCVQILFLGLCT